MCIERKKLFSETNSILLLDFSFLNRIKNFTNIQHIVYMKNVYLLFTLNSMIDVIILYHISIFVHIKCKTKTI